MCQWIKDVENMLDQHAQPASPAVIEPVIAAHPDTGDDFVDYEDEEPYWDGSSDEDEPEDNLSDVEADAMALAGAGYGTDEDYGFYGGDY